MGDVVRTLNSFRAHSNAHTYTHTHPFNSPISRTTQVSRYQKGKTNLDFTGARDSEWQWHQLGHMQVWTSLQTDNHTSTSPLSFLQAECPSCRPTNSVKALKANSRLIQISSKNPPVCSAQLCHLATAGASDSSLALDYHDLPPCAPIDSI